MAVLSPDGVQTLLKDGAVRDGQRATAQHVQQPSEHDQVILLEIRDILRRVIR